MPEPTVPSFPSFMPDQRVPMANVTQVPVATPAPVVNASEQIGPDGISPAEAEYRARRAAARQQQADLEAKHGKLGVLATQATRGALDALLAPGALAGLFAEGTGYATGWKGLEDFGRGLGQAAQGKELMAAVGADPGAFAGALLTAPLALVGVDPALGAKLGSTGDVHESRGEYQDTVRTIREQEQAWPMLSATSRLAGSVAFGVGTGSLAGHAGVGSQALVGGIEGTGFGAQTGYEKNAPLRDVVTSALIGGTLGVAAPVAIGKGLPYVQEKARAGLRDFAERSAFKAGAGNYKAAYNQITRFGKEPERINRVGRKLLDRGVDLDDLDEMARGIGAEADDAALRLDTVATTLDDAGTTVSTREALSEADKLIASYRREAFGDYHAIADRLERTVAPLRNRVDQMAFSDYWKLRRSFDDLLYDETGRPLKGAVGKAMEKLRGRLDEQLTKAVDGADGEVGKMWRAAKEDYGDFATMKRISDELIQNREKNRFFSPSDHGLGIGGAILSVAAGDVSGLTGAAVGAGLAAANKFARERGRGMLARFADRLAGHADEATGHAVSVAAAGGKEAQEAITAIDRARRAITEAGELAGDNPAAQQAARRAAQQQVGDELLQKAGPLNANWIKNPPNTLQKVLHRSQILDQVAGDVSGAVQKVAALRPTLATLQPGKPVTRKLFAQLDLEGLDKTTMRPADLARAEKEIARDGVEGLAGGKYPPTITVDAATGQPTLRNLTDGRHRLLAAQRAGHTEAPVIIRRLDDEGNVTLERARIGLGRPRPEAAPSTLSQRRLGKLLEDADGPAAIGGLQMRVGKLMEQLPRSADGEAMRVGLKAISQQLQTAGKAEAMRVGHDLVRRMTQAAAMSGDAVVKSYAQRAAQELGQELSGEAWGTAGKYYATLNGAPSTALAAFSDPKVMREALRSVELRGSLASAARKAADDIRAAQTAAAELTGAKPTVSEADLNAMVRLFEKAEETVTLDGGPVNRVVEWFANKLDERVAGSLGAHVSRQLGDQPGHAAETAVLHAVQSRLSKVAKVLHTAGHTAQHTGTHLAQSGAIGAAMEGRAPKAALAAGVAAAAVAPRLLTPQEKTQQYKQRVDLLAEVTRDQDGLDIHDGLAAIRQIAPGLEGDAARDMLAKLQQLEADMPKPKQTFRGIEMPSSQDVRLGNAMWEATVDPMSVFDDFAAGVVDYDKVRYAWKQYPGLKTAASMGLQDMLYQQLDEEQRAYLPENVLSQLDNLFGLEGGLQPTLAPDFVRTVDSIAADFRSQQKPRAAKPIDLPTSNPTPMQRVAGAMR